MRSPSNGPATDATGRTRALVATADSRDGAETPSLLEAALDYAGRGWPVFPLAERGKLPKIASAHSGSDPLRGECHGECGRDGHGFFDASTEAEKVAAWWSRWPSANIGVRTGVVFDVLDIDHGGCRSLMEHLDTNGCLPSGPTSATPSDGVHHYFKPTGLGNAAGFLPGLDWRGVGGYVVAPPSTRAERVYEWGLTPWEFPLPAAPEWLLALHSQSRRAEAPTEHPRPPVTAGAYGRRALETEVGRVLLTHEGGRNHQLNSAAFSLGSLVAGGVLGAEEVAGALLEAATRSGLSEAEAVRTIRSGLTGGMRQPRGRPA